MHLNGYYFSSYPCFFKNPTQTCIIKQFVCINLLCQLKNWCFHKTLWCVASRELTMSSLHLSGPCGIAWWYSCEDVFAGADRPHPTHSSHEGTTGRGGLCILPGAGPPPWHHTQEPPSQGTNRSVPGPQKNRASVQCFDILQLTLQYIYHLKYSSWIKITFVVPV